jgi:hypothetical protein
MKDLRLRKDQKLRKYGSETDKLFMSDPLRQDGFFTSTTLYEIYLLYRQKHYWVHYSQKRGIKSNHLAVNYFLRYLL